MNFRSRLNLVFLPTLVAILFVVHFYPFDFSALQLINYDDEIFIRPMLNLGIDQYFSKWLPNPHNYAFPLRDLTLFIDGWLSEPLGFGFYYFTNFLIFVCTLVCLNALGRMVLPQSPWARLFFVVFIALHPLNVEMVQWASTRKNIMPPLFIALGNLVVFRRLLQEKALNGRDWLMISLAQAASLACYPVTLLWLPWVLCLQYGLLKKRQIGLGLAILGLASIAYLRFAAPSGSDFEASFRVLASQVDRVTYFFVRSLGRGFFNTVWPDQLTIYYDADNVRSFIGFGLFWVYLGLVAFLLRGVREKKDRKLLGALASLFCILMLPQAHVFLSFADFRWADRYSYVVNPFFFLFNIVLLQRSSMITNLQRFVANALKPQGIRLVGVAVAASLGGVFIALSRQLVPLWRSEMTLQDDCVMREGSPKCLAIMMSEYFTEDCPRARVYIDLGYKRYQEDKPPYSSQFTNELPFYDATCIALTASITPAQKLTYIPFVFDRYAGSPGPVFGMVLSHLESDQIDEALKLARTYYLSGNGQTLSTSKLLIEIYLGHTRALCEIANTQECWENRERFAALYPGYPEKAFATSWGYRITKMMHERRLTWRQP